MTTTDYAIDALLILVIFRQVRETRSDWRSLLLPLVLIAFVVSHYLTSVPTDGNDVLLDVVLGGVGIALGTACGLTMRQRADGDGTVWTRAGRVAVAIWLAGMVSRLAFELYANGGGAASVASFSRAHEITGADAWTTALVLMAVGQALTKIVVQRARGHRLTAGTTRPAVPAL